MKPRVGEDRRVEVLVDMNLSPLWCSLLSTAGHRAVHWSQVGDPRAPDSEIMAYAASHEFVVFTHDLDFSAMLAASGDREPSVLQVRCPDTLPEVIGPLVLAALSEFQEHLRRGALLVLEPARSRVRLLPLRRDRT